jgi:hypothetical protein
MRKPGISTSLDCLERHTDGRFMLLNGCSREGCKSIPICNAILYDYSCFKLKAMYDEHKLEIANSRQVSQNWIAIGCNNK